MLAWYWGILALFSLGAAAPPYMAGGRVLVVAGYITVGVRNSTCPVDRADSMSRVVCRNSRFDGVGWHLECRAQDDHLEPPVDLVPFVGSGFSIECNRSGTSPGGPIYTAGQCHVEIEVPDSPMLIWKESTACPSGCVRPRDAQGEIWWKTWEFYGFLVCTNLLTAAVVAIVAIMLCILLSRPRRNMPPPDPPGPEAVPEPRAPPDPPGPEVAPEPPATRRRTRSRAAKF